MKLETVALVLGIAGMTGISCDKPQRVLYDWNIPREAATESGWKYVEYVHHTEDPSCSYLSLPGHSVLSVTIQGINAQNQPTQTELCCLATPSSVGEDNYYLDYCQFKE